VSRLLRVGDLILNFDNVAYVAVRDNDTVFVKFSHPAGDEGYSEMEFKGSQAKALIDWLIDTDNVEYCPYSGGSF
jgi:hypothetical protein